MASSIFAVVVTFQRPAVLKKCLDSLLTQVDFGLKRIHIVVNSNDEESADLLHSYNSYGFMSYEFLDNPGPAGGFNAGLQRFITEDLSHVWLMDDDIVVKDNCLERLLNCSVKAEYVCPRVISRDGKDLGLFGWWGILLSRNIVQRAGFPMTDLFYWIEDTEYLQHRVKRVFNANPLRCNEAIVEHWHERKSRRPSWYYYYVARNTLYYRIYLVPFTWRRLRRSIILAPNLLIRILFKENNKVLKIKLLFWGIFHGCAGKIGKLVDPAKNK